MPRPISAELAQVMEEQARLIQPELVYADHVIIGDRLRRIDPAVVDALVLSIAEIGLKVPITVRLEDHPDRQLLFLVAGAHRLAAVQKLGWERIPAVFTEADATDVRRWEIAENLHRAELTALERAEHIREWVRLTEEKGVSAQVAPKLSARGRNGEGRPEGGINAAVRDLGLERTEAQRAVKIAEGLTPEAKAAAVAGGLDDNQSVLLQVARLPADQQVNKVTEIVCLRQEPRQASAETKPSAGAVSIQLHKPAVMEPLMQTTVPGTSAPQAPTDQPPSADQRQMDLADRLTRVLDQGVSDLAAMKSDIHPAARQQLAEVATLCRKMAEAIEGFLARRPAGTPDSSPHQT